jgi:hypothetical protein
MRKCVVTDRVLVLGLDGLFRDAMQAQETSILLPCARMVAAALGVSRSEAPVEGYYAESAQLAEYFGLVTALRGSEPKRRTEVGGMPAFRRLEKVCSSRIFGWRRVDSGLLPSMRDSLSQALADAEGAWEMGALIDASAALARTHDDFSLVGLASLLSDGVCLTALRETVVLYAEAVITADNLDDLLQEPVYEWDVSDEVGRQANRFIDGFNGLFHARLPAARAENAKSFWGAADSANLGGRCVRIGVDINSLPPRYYHWKIDTASDGSLVAGAFWSEELWTTERYRQSLRR